MSTDDPMSTDEELRNAFRTAFAPAVGGVTADPAMLSVVRRRHARQQRLLAVGGPLGVAVVTAGAVVGATSMHSGAAGRSTPADGGQSPTSSPAPDQTVQTMQAVSLVGHNLSLPSDWTLSGNRKLIDLNTIEPAQPVGGKDQSVTATSPDGSQQFSATVYSGPIADGERGGGNAATDDPSFDHVSINGNEAAIKVTGPPTTCFSVSASTHPPSSRRIKGMVKHARLGHATPKGYGVVKGVCPSSETANAPYGEARYSFGDGDFMIVDTFGMDSAALTSFLTAALTS